MVQIKQLTISPEIVFLHETKLCLPYSALKHVSNYVHQAACLQSDVNFECRARERLCTWKLFCKESFTHWIVWFVINTISFNGVYPPIGEGRSICQNAVKMTDKVVFSRSCKLFDYHISLCFILISAVYRFRLRCNGMIVADRAVLNLQHVRRMKQYFRNIRIKMVAICLKMSLRHRHIFQLYRPAKQ